MLSDEWLSRYGLLENFNTSVTRTRTRTRTGTGTGTWTTEVTAIALCTSCSRAKNVYPCLPKFYYITLGCKGVFILWKCFPNGTNNQKNIQKNIQTLTSWDLKQDTGLSLSLYVRKQTIWVPTRTNTKQHVQSQKQARG